MTLLNVRERLRQFYLMPHAIAAADARAQQKGQAGVKHLETARSLLATAESWRDSAEQTVAALALLSRAAVFALRGFAQRRLVDVDESEPRAIWEQLCESTDVPSTIQVMSANAREQIARLIASGLTTNYVDWSQAELRALKESALQVVQAIVSHIEDDICAPQQLRAQRRLRWGSTLVALVVLGCYGGWKIHQLGVVVNLALHQAVTTSSSYHPELFPPDTLVDGIKTQLGCHTDTQENPWAMIDLGGNETIRRVEVTNRPDGLTSRAVPLVIETSLDGKYFVEAARKDQDFSVWTAILKPTKARYVRVKVLSTTVLHLAEIEVY